MEDETEEMEMQEASPSDEADIETATGLLATAILNPKGEQALVSALTAKNPIASLAQFLVQAIDAIQTRSMSTEIPLNPAIWLAHGGPIDEAMKDIAEIAADNKIPFKIAQTLPPLRDKIVEYLTKMKDEYDAGGQQPQQPAPQPGLAAPRQGGM